MLIHVLLCYWVIDLYTWLYDLSNVRNYCCIFLAKLIGVLLDYDRVLWFLISFNGLFIFSEIATPISFSFSFLPIGVVSQGALRIFKGRRAHHWWKRIYGITLYLCSLLLGVWMGGGKGHSVIIHQWNVHPTSSLNIHGHPNPIPSFKGLQAR